MQGVFPEYYPKENGGFEMKKLLLLMMVLILSLSLVACGGGGDSEEAAPDASTPEASDIALVS